MSTAELVIKFPVYTLAREVQILDETFACALAPLAPRIRTGDASFRAILLFTDREGAEEYMAAEQISKPVCLVEMANIEAAKAFLESVPSDETERILLDPRQGSNLRTWPLESFLRGFEDMTQ